MESNLDCIVCVLGCCLLSTTQQRSSGVIAPSSRLARFCGAGVSLLACSPGAVCSGEALLADLNPSRFLRCGRSCAGLALVQFLLLQWRECRCAELARLVLGEMCSPAVVHNARRMRCSSWWRCGARVQRRARAGCSSVALCWRACSCSFAPMCLPFRSSLRSAAPMVSESPSWAADAIPLVARLWRKESILRARGSSSCARLLCRSLLASRGARSLRCHPYPLVQLRFLRGLVWRLLESRFLCLLV